jgi:hypothetical protein
MTGERPTDKRGEPADRDERAGGESDSDRANTVHRGISVQLATPQRGGSMALGRVHAIRVKTHPDADMNTVRNSRRLGKPSIAVVRSGPLRCGRGVERDGLGHPRCHNAPIWARCHELRVRPGAT